MASTYDFTDKSFGTAVVDDSLGYAYFSSTYTSNQIVRRNCSCCVSTFKVCVQVRMQLNDTASQDTLGLDSTDTQITSVVHDSFTHRAFYGTDLQAATGTSRVIAVNLCTCNVLRRTTFSNAQGQSLLHAWDTP